MKNKLLYFILYLFLMFFAAFVAVKIVDFINQKPPSINNPFLIIDSNLIKKKDSIKAERIKLEKTLMLLQKTDSINLATATKSIIIVKKEYEKINNFNDTTRRFWFDSVFSANNVFK